MEGVRFGLGVPTATEGMMYPIPFADPAQAVDLAVQAEALGFESVWANDHMTTQRYVRAEFEEPPRFYDPLGYLAFVAARTERIRLATGVLVMSFRHPVAAAKQLATLDQLSGGRVVAGLGIGAYREEFEAMWPGRSLHRGEHAAEFIEALRLLFSERRASFEGKHISFTDVESFPKPAQRQLPVLSGGNSPGSIARAAHQAHGWLPACLTPAEYAKGVAEMDVLVAESGRELPAGFERCLQLVVSVASTTAGADARFEESQVYNHLRSLSDSTLRGRLNDDLTARNLVGSVEQVRDQIGRYVEAGVGTFAGLLFATDTPEETIEAMARFSEDVIATSR